MRTRLIPLLLALALAAGACGGDDGDDSSDAGDGTSTTVPEDADEPGDDSTVEDPPVTTTEPDNGSGSTTSAPANDASPTGVLAEGRVDTAEGLRVDWELTADSDSLCFRATPSHDDPALAEFVGDGPDDCVTPDGGLDDLGDSGLSVDVGTVDGDKTVGYLWGRVAPEVIVLNIEHADSTTSSIPILEGPTEAGVFVYVVEIDTIPEVDELEAVSGTRVEGVAAIRGFLRSGPTYPTVEPPTTTPLPDYPVS